MYVSHLVPSPCIHLNSITNLLESIWRKMANDSMISELLRGLKKLYMVLKLGHEKYVQIPSGASKDIGK